MSTYDTRSKWAYFVEHETVAIIKAKVTKVGFNDTGKIHGCVKVEAIDGKIHVKFLEENFEIEDTEVEETISDRPSKVKISLDDTVNSSLAPQRPKKIGMDLTGNIKNPGLIFAEMQGTIMDTLTKNGKKVKKGDSLFVLQAMKMENIITSPIDGVIKQFNVEKGQAVKKGDLLAEIEARF